MKRLPSIWRSAQRFCRRKISLTIRHLIRTSVLLLGTFGLRAQELQPRAYLPAPIGLTYASISYSGNSGGLLFDPSLPVEDANVRAYIPTLAVGGGINVFGRSGQVLAILPYVVADFRGTIGDTEHARHRSGLADTTYRFSSNIYGAPALHGAEFAKYRPKTLVGASLTVTAPTGQYDPNLLINIGQNRWAIKPELGISHFVGRWDFEVALGAWLYTTNSNFYGGQIRKQDPLGSVQTHIVRLLPHRMWVAFDGTFYTGGRSYVGDTIKADYQANTRFGGTWGMALGSRHAIRVAYFTGATTRVGQDIQSLSVAYQIFWQALRER